MPAHADRSPGSGRRPVERDRRALPPAAALGRPPNWQELKARRALTPDDLPTFVQLEDHEWTRVALGLSTTGHGVPLAWRLGPDSLAATLRPAASGRPAALGLSPTAGSGRTDAEPPAPFTETAEEPARWLLHKYMAAIDALPAVPRVLAASRRSALVTLWQQDGVRCLLDIMAVGGLAIDGPPVAAGSTLSDIVVELGSRRWCDLDEVYLVGFGRELHGLEEIRFLPEVRDALALLRSGDPDVPAPSRCFVVAPAPPGTGERGNLLSLLRLAALLPRTAVVCCEPSLPVGAIWHLASRGETLHLELSQPVGSINLLDPRHDTDPEHPLPVVDDPDEPKSDAHADDAPATLEERLARRFSAGPFVLPLTASPPAPVLRPGGVEIRVLGPLDIVGASIPVDQRPRLTELLVYVAFHRETIVRELVGGALWPDRRVQGQTIANRLSEARRALGQTADGRSRLRRVDGRLRLEDDVVTDWERFCELTSDGSGPQSWRLALSLVRGRPFVGLAQAEWTVLEGHAAGMERAIVETALALGEYYLSVSNPPAADWAIQQGLLASPWDEQLYRLLMRSGEAAGNRGAIDAALRALAQVLELRGDPLLGVHPATAQLYRDLTDRGGEPRPQPPGARPPR